MNKEEAKNWKITINNLIEMEALIDQYAEKNNLGYVVNLCIFDKDESIGHSLVNRGGKHADFTNYVSALTCFCDKFLKIYPTPLDTFMEKLKLSIEYMASTFEEKINK